MSLKKLIESNKHLFFLLIFFFISLKTLAVGIQLPALTEHHRYFIANMNRELSFSNASSAHTPSPHGLGEEKSEALLWNPKNLEKLITDDDQHAQDWFIFCHKRYHIEVDYRHCLAEQMRMHQISPLRVAFAHAFGGWINSVRKMGNVFFVEANVLGFQIDHALILVSATGFCFDFDTIDFKRWLWNSVVHAEHILLTQYPQARLSHADVIEETWQQISSADWVVYLRYGIMDGLYRDELIGYVMIPIKVSQSGEHIVPLALDIQLSAQKIHPAGLSNEQGGIIHSLPRLVGVTPPPGLIQRRTPE